MYFMGLLYFYRHLLTVHRDKTGNFLSAIVFIVMILREVTGG